MKKFKRLAAALLLAAVSAFAFADYSGDLQLRLLGFNITSFESTKNSSGTLTRKDMIDAGMKQEDLSFFGYDFGLTTYHTWMIVEKYLGIGFAYNMDLGISSAASDAIGVTTSMLFAPAISSTIGEAVRFELAPGLNFGMVGTIGGNYAGFTSGAGFGLDFTAVFFPNAVFSPVFGFQFATVSGTSLNSSSFSSSSSSVVTTDTYSEIKLFIGGAFNFGRD